MLCDVKRRNKVYFGHRTFNEDDQSCEEGDSTVGSRKKRVINGEK